MDDSARFKLYPPKSVLPLYERILTGGEYVRRKEGTADMRKQKECNTPEAVYRCKVVCNFLMELIEREKRRQKTKTFVDWQSIQRRYQEMCTDGDNEDRNLMEEYKNKYKMAFPQNILNSEVIKTWTGRSTITKALSMPIFCKIIPKVELNTGSLFVNFGDSTTLYSDEELKKAYQAMVDDKEQRDKSFKKEQRRRKESALPECTPEELANIVPLRQRQPQSVVTSIIPDAALSPFSAPHEMEVKEPTSEWTDSRPVEGEHTTVNMSEPQYIPTAASIDESSVSNAYSDSDDDGKISGVYTDEEELEEAVQSTKVPKKTAPVDALRQRTGHSSATTLESTLRTELRVCRDEPKLSFHSKPSAMQGELRRPEETVKSFANPWEVCQEEPTLRTESDAKQKNSLFASHVAATPASVSASTAQIHSRSPVESRHTSAFASCRSTPTVAKKESDSTKFAGRVSAGVDIERMTKRGDLYERKSNMRYQQEEEYRKSNVSNDGDLRCDYDRRDTNGLPSPTCQYSNVAEPRAVDFDNYNSGSLNRTTFQPIQHPLRTAPETSVFARPIATSCVRTRTPVRSDTNRAKESPRSYNAIGGKEYSEDAPNRNSNDTYQQLYRHRNEEPYGQKLNSSRDRAYSDEERSRPRLSTSRFDYGKYDDQYADSKPYNTSWRGECREEKYRNDTFGYSERDYLHSSYGNDDGNYARRFNGSFEERNINYGRDGTKRGYGNDNRQSDAERNSSGYRQQEREYPSRSGSGNNFYVQAHAAMEHNFPNKPNECNRRGSHEKVTYESNTTRQEQSKRNTPTSPLTEDQRARLRIIRDFTFLYRDSAHGYQTLENLFKILPVDNDVNWELLIKSRLPQIELANFRGSPVLIWKKGSNPEDSVCSI